MGSAKLIIIVLSLVTGQVQSVKSVDMPDMESCKAVLDATARQHPPKTIVSCVGE